MNWRNILKEDDDEEWDPETNSRQWKKRTSPSPGVKDPEDYTSEELDPDSPDFIPPEKRRKYAQPKTGRTDREQWKFQENFGEIQDADIANWFQTIQQKFEEMLGNISLGEVESLDMTTGETERDKYDTLNKKKVKILGIDIASDVLFAAVEGYMKSIQDSITFTGATDVTSEPRGTPNPDELHDEDKPSNVDGIYGSHEYQIIWEKAYQFIETLMSAVFDDCYETVKQMHDDPADVSQMKKFPLNPNEELPEEFMEMADRYIETEKEELPQIVEDFEKALTGILTDANLKPVEGDSTGPKVSQKIASAIADNVKKVFDTPEVRNNMREFKGYVLFSFIVKYPNILQTLAQSKQADQPQSIIEQGGAEPAEGYSTGFERDPERQQPNQPEDEYFDASLPIDPNLFNEGEPKNYKRPERLGADIPIPRKPNETDAEYNARLAEKRRRDFEDKRASANTSPISWMDVLKNTGPTLTTSQGFAPAMHNLRYSEPCECGELTKKQCDCGE
tara:strand:+ start:9287 stop:10804 length:1518 start_codon:yes stop_codon:yes gene_type:complete